MANKVMVSHDAPKAEVPVGPLIWVKTLETGLYS